MGKTLQLKTPEWAVPLLDPSRYKAAWGGRGSVAPAIGQTSIGNQDSGDERWRIL